MAAARLRSLAADHPLVSGFQWQTDATLAASWSSIITALIVYAVVISLLKLIIKSPVPLGPLQALHNAVLAVASAAIFVCSSYSAFSLRDLSWLVCLPPGTRPSGPVFFWSYAYYLTKYYELVDTVIIALRKRHLTLFHVLQHAGNLVVCFLWLDAVQSLQLFFLLTNTAIQTMLYLYFLATSVGFNPPVKQLVTLSQIFHLFFNLVAMAALYLGFLQRGYNCSGTSACFVNAAFNLVLMLLLINYYVRVYLKPAVSTKSRRKGYQRPQAQKAD